MDNINRYEIAHPDDQNEEENEDNLRKNERKYWKWGQIEEIFLSCPSGVRGWLRPYNHPI